METDVIGRLMARNEELVRANVRLCRKLGRKSWQLNQAVQREEERRKGTGALSTVAATPSPDVERMRSENADLRECLSRQVKRRRELRCEAEALRDERVELRERINREVERTREARAEAEALRRDAVASREEREGLHAQGERQTAHIAVLEKRLEQCDADRRYAVRAMEKKGTSGYVIWDTERETVAGEFVSGEIHWMDEHARQWMETAAAVPAPAEPEAVSEPRYIARKADAGYQTFDTKDEVVMNTWRTDLVPEAKAREYAENYAAALNKREEVSQ